MNCFSCERQLSGNPGTCIYCGASLDSSNSCNTSTRTGDNVSFIISETKPDAMGLNDLPEDVRNQVKDAFENVNSDGVDTVKSTVVQDMVVEDKAETIPISLDNVLNLVSGLDESLNSGNIEQAEYKRMVTYILQDYITALAPDIRLHFVFTDLMNSELSQYLSDDILKELRESALSSI